MNLLAFERVATDQLTERIGLMRGGSLLRAHFMQNDTRTSLRGLKCGLTACEAGTDDLYRAQVSILGVKMLRDTRRKFCEACPKSRQR